MAQSLRVIADMAHPGSDPVTFPWALLDYEHTQSIRAQLAARYSTNTANKMLAALRGTLKEAWRLGQMPAEQYQRAADVQTIKGTTLPKGRALRPVEMTALFRSCDVGGGVAGIRDAALLAVLYSAGLRRAEVVALDVSDWDPTDSSLLIRSGKGNKTRQGWLAGFAHDRLQAYLERRTDAAGALFCRIRRGDHLTAERLTAGAIRSILLKRCEQANVTPISPHSMRRSYVTALLESGTDIATASKLAGHSSVSTTMRYDRRNDDAARAAVQRLHVP